MPLRDDAVPARLPGAIKLEGHAIGAKDAERLISAIRGSINKWIIHRIHVSHR